MIETQDININGAPGTYEVIVREGAQGRNPEDVQLSGNHLAPAIFAENRKPNPANSSVMYIEKARQIVLVINEAKLTSEPFIKVIGTLSLTDDYKALGLNGDMGHLKKAADLAKHLRKYKRYFVSESEFNAVQNALKNLSIKIEANLTEAKETRTGAVSKGQVKTTNFEPISFRLGMPIFSGSMDETFMVEVMIDATSENVMFWLESDDVLTLVPNLEEKLILPELEKLRDLGLAVMQA